MQHVVKILTKKCSLWGDFILPMSVSVLVTWKSFNVKFRPTAKKSSDRVFDKSLSIHSLISIYLYQNRLVQTTQNLIFPTKSGHSVLPNVVAVLEEVSV